MKMGKGGFRDGEGKVGMEEKGVRKFRCVVYMCSLPKVNAIFVLQTKRENKLEKHRTNIMPVLILVPPLIHDMFNHSGQDVIDKYYTRLPAFNNTCTNSFHSL